jgi:6-pyruvoyltetrahydropterin/6-carboxytetrahydropterin synthase
MIAVTRRYEIPAAHVLANPKLSDTENDEIFGKCANPAGHGHNYGLEITVTGPVDPERGQIVPPDLLDEIFREAITERYSHTMLNATRGFEDCVPTTENFAKVVFDELAPVVERRSRARLVRVRLTETPRNTFEYGEPI